MVTPLPSGTFYGDTSNCYEAAGFTLSETRYQGGSALPRHAHELPYFGLILKGAYSEQYERSVRSCRPLMLVFHPAGETHAQRFDGLPVHLFRVELAKTRIKDTRLRKHDLAACHFRRGEAIGLALKLYREFRDPDTVSPLVIEGLALELTAVVARNSLRPSGETIHPPQRWLRAAHELIKSRFRETLALNDIAQAVGIHPVTLAREFRKVYGHTIGEMVRRERIGFACDQIVKGDVTLSELGISAGFYDQSHFAKTFKRLLGVTPSEYRRHYLLD